ncbi:protein, SNF2 family [Hoylesella loescheii DSM 19665 = JCM 12249 = ATCC 15930]|uniref:Protein, SNF2 family n=2 Tax=Hoylesella loescheii TaxID=840 RepID=A0A069QPF8_HOYLO|nr:protein, SNF2 family [Hoylesella loescheii DSM 19665 = JCM 12249 = ATCC 15930]
MKDGLMSNQSECLKHLMDWKVGAIFMDAGTGKTRVAMEIIKCSSCDMVVWIAPLRTIPNLKDEIGRWGGLGCSEHYFGIESIGQSDRIYMQVVNLLENNRSVFVVVDESLKIKNMEAKRTKRLLVLSKMVEFKLILNGTPLSRNLLDLWAQMEFLHPRILNMDFCTFKNTFCDYTTITKTQGRKRITREFINGYENIDYLYSLIGHYVYRCDLKLNVAQQYQVIRYTVGEREKELYDEIKEKFLDDETLEFRNNNIFLEMTQKMQHAYCCTQDKFNKLDVLFSTIPQEETIIFCKYVDSRHECENRYRKSKVLSYQKEAFGLNLQKYRYTVYFDKIWDYALRVQSSRRTYRTGQTFDCLYYDLTGNVGLEMLIDRNIEKKISMTEYFKRKTKEEIKEDL